MSEIAETRDAGEKSQGVGEHVVVKSVDIVFDKGIKPSQKLHVSVANNKASAKRINKADLPERTHRWSLSPELSLFPDDKLIIRPSYSRTDPSHWGISRDSIDSHTILATDIISFCLNHSTKSPSDEVNYPATQSGQFSKITLKVFLRGFSGALVELDTTSLNPSAESEILESLSSGKSLQEAASELGSVLGKLGAKVEIIQNLEDMLENMALAHPLVKAAVTALLIPYKLLKAEHEFKKDLQSLADEMQFAFELMEDGRCIADISSTRKAVTKIMKEVIRTSLFINEFVNKGRFKQFGAAQTRAKLDEHRERLEKLRKDFETALNLQNVGVGAETARVVHKIAEDDNEKKMQEFLEKKLEPATQQPLGDLCLQGTRATILDDVEKWLKDTSRPNVLWISGAPGAGKSTISATIVKKILKFECARFFVKRGATPELRDPRRIWRSVAFDLAEKYRGVKDNVTKALREKEAEYPKDAEIGEQFCDLLESPIRKHSESFPADRPCVVIIDALDECRTSDGDWSDLLETLVGWSKLPSNVKLIVTSRNEKDIRDHLQAVSECIVLETGNDVSEETSNDILLFFKSRFQKMRVPDKSWPGEETLIRLTRHAAGLFIWAKTVVEFVGHKNWHPPRRLKIICDDMKRGSSDIDGLYGHVLYETFSDMEGQELNVAKFVLAAVSLGKAPFSIQGLVELLAPEAGGQWDEAGSAVLLAVEAFSPIINVRDDILSVCHKTLSDFLTNETRMKNVIKQALERAQKPVDEGNMLRYTTRYSEQNGRLVEACLRLMNTKLKFNICHIPTSHCFNEAIPNREALVEEHIPRILLYACQYWAEHLYAADADASHTQDTILPILKYFLETHILHWLEVLSFTYSMDGVFFSLSCAERYTKMCDDTLSELARDARKFTKTFQDVITVSAPHIYLSALPFAPTESKLAQVYGPRHPNTLSVLTGRVPGRNEMLPLAEMRGHSNHISCLAYLPDGKRIASGSDDGTIRIWDAHSGRAMTGVVSELSGSLLALSPLSTGDKLASLCSDGTFQVWDINEKECTFNMKMFQNGDAHFSFGRGDISPDGENCAAFGGQTFKIWGTKDGRLKVTETLPEEHPPSVGSLKFLPDGSNLIYAYGSGPIVVRDTKNWEIEATLTVTDWFTRCLAVSLDGKLFASGHLDGEVQLYNYPEGRHLGNLMLRHEAMVSCIEFSADSSLLVSGFVSGTLCFWDTKTQKLIGGPHHFSENIKALSFSPDGSRLAAAVGDAIQVFDVDTSLSLEAREVERPGGVTGISCVAFDKYRRRFATGSNGGVLRVRVWDVHSGQMLAEWADDASGDPNWVSSLAFVEGSELIAFSSRSGHVRKWDWKTRQLCRDVLIEGLRNSASVFVTMSPDGRLVAFAVKGDDGYISLWDYDTDCEVHRFPAHNSHSKLAFSSDGELVAFGTSKGTIGVWRVAFTTDADAHPICSVKWDTRTIYDIAFSFSPDAKQLALITGSYAEEKQLHIWDIATSSEPKLLGKTTQNISSIQFSLSGDIIVVNSFDGSTQFWSVSTSESTGYGLETGNFLAAEFLNDGTLITVDMWGATKIWDVVLWMDGRSPLLLQSTETLDSSNTVKVTFVKDSSSVSVPPPRVVRENRDKGASLDNPSISYPAFFDAMDEPVIGDWSYFGRRFTEMEGWVRNRRASGENSDDDPILFWVPPANRASFWWPRITTITNPSMDEPVTRIDFSRFMHGENWHLCGEPGLYKKHDA